MLLHTEQEARSWAQLGGTSAHYCSGLRLGGLSRPHAVGRGPRGKPQVHLPQQAVRSFRRSRTPARGHLGRRFPGEWPACLHGPSSACPLSHQPGGRLVTARGPSNSRCPGAAARRPLHTCYCYLSTGRVPEPGAGDGVSPGGSLCQPRPHPGGSLAGFPLSWVWPCSLQLLMLPVEKCLLSR